MSSLFQRTNAIIRGSVRGQNMLLPIFVGLTLRSCQEAIANSEFASSDVMSIIDLNTGLASTSNAGAVMYNTTVLLTEAGLDAFFGVTSLAAPYVIIMAPGGLANELNSYALERAREATTFSGVWEGASVDAVPEVIFVDSDALLAAAGSLTLPPNLSAVNEGLTAFLNLFPPASVEEVTTGLYRYGPPAATQSEVSNALGLRFGADEQDLFLIAARNTFTDSDIDNAILTLASKGIVATRDNILGKIATALVSLLP